ncbi:MAG: hypothetical protein KDD47_07960 [Acidobacteria bacterium]|nr:hypothetical protein [Acidobacteriota bacterium]
MVFRAQRVVPGFFLLAVLGGYAGRASAADPSADVVATASEVRYASGSRSSLVRGAPRLDLSAGVVQLELPEGWFLGEVTAVELRENGGLLLFNRGAHPLLEFDSEGAFIREMGHGLFKVPHGLRLDAEGNVWTSDQETHQVLRFSPEGQVTMVLGRGGFPGTGWFDRGYSVMLLNEPSDIGFDRSGNVYVADAGNFRIVKYDSHGEPLRTWGSKGDGPGEFNFPHSIIVGPEDRIYVTDRENGRIQIFDTEGRFLDEWAQLGAAYVLTPGSDGTLWMTDARAGVIMNLDLEGSILGTFGEWGKEVGDFGFGHGIAVAKDGSIYVSELLNWRVQVLRPRGK